MERPAALQVIEEVLGSIEPAAAKQFVDSPTPGRPEIVVNGLRVPVIRVGWSNVEPFFTMLFKVSNQRFFAGALPECRLGWNRRFRNLGGRIDCTRRRVELSAPHYEACGAAAIGVVLLHEMIHLSLFEERRPFGHTPLFKSRSVALGMPRIHHEMPLPDRLKGRRNTHLYACPCGAVIRSRIQFRAPRACAACCRRHAKGRYDARFQLRYVGVEGGTTH